MISMKNVMKKLLAALLVLIFFGSLMVPGFTGAGNRNRAWNADIEVTDIILEGKTQAQGSPDINGNYLNQSYDVKVTVTNSGERTLTDLNVTCVITNGTTEYFNTWDTLSKLNIARCGNHLQMD